jgi:hypothetical protein
MRQLSTSFSRPDARIFDSCDGDPVRHEATRHPARRARSSAARGVEVPPHPIQIADPVAVRVGKGPRVDLVEDGFLAPRLGHRPNITLGASGLGGNGLVPHTQVNTPIGYWLHVWPGAQHAAPQTWAFGQQLPAMQVWSAGQQTGPVHSRAPGQHAPAMHVSVAAQQIGPHTWALGQQTGPVGVTRQTSVPPRSGTRQQITMVAGGAFGFGPAQRDGPNAQTHRVVAHKGGLQQALFWGDAPLTQQKSPHVTEFGGQAAKARPLPKMVPAAVAATDAAPSLTACRLVSPAPKTGVILSNRSPPAMWRSPHSRPNVGIAIVPNGQRSRRYHPERCRDSAPTSSSTTGASARPFEAETWMQVGDRQVESGACMLCSSRYAHGVVPDRDGSAVWAS